MSAKPTEAKAEEKVDEVAKQLSETKINGDEDAKVKAKAAKKARQKAQKDALKVIKSFIIFKGIAVYFSTFFTMF